MQTAHHTLEDLFEQLGLERDDKAIAQFVSSHKPLSENTLLFEADFWSASQSALLKEAISEDADWAIAAVRLNSLLRT